MRAPSYGGTPDRGSAQLDGHPPKRYGFRHEARGIPDLERPKTKQRRSPGEEGRGREPRSAAPRTQPAARPSIRSWSPDWSGTAPAPWARGKRAGPERNAFLLRLTGGIADELFEMFETEAPGLSPTPVLVAAPLSGGKGTQDMIWLAKSNIIDVVMVPGSNE